MILEYEDIEKHLPRFVADLKRELMKELEKDKFISYPQGMQKHYGISYKVAWKNWSKPNFPRKEKDGVKGAYLSDLKEYGL
ncbi:MAG: hypothetical protein NXI20_28400 [bacterium]|nr:hypothetical protein [bacterium]